MDKIIIGLTGQSGAGKSTVSKIFKRYGFYVIDADNVAREITSKPEIVERLSENFGKNILRNDGQLNRKVLASIVFSDKKELEKLNSLLFPVICDKINTIIKSVKSRYILLDAPQLFESGSDKICNTIISVIAPHDILVDRIMARDNLSKEDAEKRLASQLTESFFRENSDYVIVNDNLSHNSYNDIVEIIFSIMKGVDTFEF